MEKSSAQLRHWDWTSVILLFILLQMVAARLLSTNWTPHLNFIQTFTSMGMALGLALGYSHFTRRTARWLSFLYMLLMLPLQWTLIFDEGVSLEERLVSIGGRLLFSISEFLSRRPVEDPLFFVAIMSVIFWIMSASAGFRLIRDQNFLAVTLPSAIGLLVIQNYDNFEDRLWVIAFFAFNALCLLGRLNFLQNQKRWKEKRIFLSPESNTDLASGMAIAAGLIILIAWSIPHSISSIDAARQAWGRATKPWTDFTERMQNAVSALRSPSPGRSTEFFGTELQLGLGFPLSESIMFTVQAPSLSVSEKPPRYYWRGRVYDYFANDQWYISGTTREEFSPLGGGPSLEYVEGKTPKRFVFSTGETKFSLVYAPAQPIWISRPATYLTAPAGGNDDIVTWVVKTALQPGETYQVDAVLSNPTIQQLREAGTEYPEWIAEKYLQLPEDFSPRLSALAVEVTASAETPYDKAAAITRYLRETIAYSDEIPSPPRNEDPLEWVIFEHKQAYCVYYASAQVLMLRSLGIPARMAVGFSQGQALADGPVIGGEEESISPNTYTVRQREAHAWPEVYFPGVGWVEFEPTGGQPALSRPSSPQNLASIQPPPIPDFSGSNGQGDEFQGERPELENPDTTPAGALLSLLSLLYLIPVFITLAALTVFLSRRYALPERIPTFVRTTLERSGTETPNWVIQWERWVTLSPIERSFESINFGLRLLKQPAPIHATPIERAEALTAILPDSRLEVKTLLDEHQTSLYTFRTANASKARRAALRLKAQIILSIVRYFLTGAYSTQTRESV
jgi:transglutaminase-like putative cysteine protease